MDGCNGAVIQRAALWRDRNGSEIFSFHFFYFDVFFCKGAMDSDSKSMRNSIALLRVYLITILLCEVFSVLLNTGTFECMIH